MQHYWLEMREGIQLGQFNHFALQGIKHGVSARSGGVSKQPFHSLNLGLHVHDDAHSVVLNRQKFCKALGLPFDRAVTADQVHGAEVAVVSEAMAGRGMSDYASALAHTDALITNCKNLPLILFFADCVPLLFYDPVKQVIGVSHAGWKGTVAKIGQKTVAAMTQEYGTDPQDCLVGIGPSIGPCCYEIDDFVLAKFQQAFAWWARVVVPQGKKWSLNLWEANRLQLLDAGIKDSQIISSQHCTSCHNELYFSYRAEKGQTGRIAAAISL